MNAHLQAAPVNSSCVHAQLCIPASATLVKTRASTRHVHSSIQSKALHADIHIHKSCSFAHAHAHTHTYTPLHPCKHTFTYTYPFAHTHTHLHSRTHKRSHACKRPSPLPFRTQAAQPPRTAGLCLARRRTSGWKARCFPWPPCKCWWRCTGSRWRSLWSSAARWIAGSVPSSLWCVRQLARCSTPWTCSCVCACVHACTCVYTSTYV